MRVSFSLRNKTAVGFFPLTMTLALSLSIVNHHPSNRGGGEPTAAFGCWSRRNALATIATIPAAAFVAPTPPASASITNPSPEYIHTVVVDAQGTVTGVELYDAKIGSKVYPAVKSVQRDSLAGTSGVKEGMILLQENSATKSTSDLVEFRIRNGPYPLILKFYDLSEETGSSNAAEALAAMQKRGGGDEQEPQKLFSLEDDAPPLLSSSDRLAVKTIQKGTDCQRIAKRGDTVEINYEAHINSPKGPMYDSSIARGGPIQFSLGKNEAILGVDISVNGMCVGEIREIDMPSSLGYGKFGSQVFDIPGDVRLWWRVELLNVKKNKDKREWPFVTKKEVVEAN